MWYRLVMVKKIFLFCLFVMGQKTFANVEYVCWKQSDIPAFAFEASSTNCDGKIKESGFPASEETVSSKKIVCIATASCVALTDNVKKILQDKLGTSTTEGLNKQSSFAILNALLNTGYTGEPSQVTCDGDGKIVKDVDNNLRLTQTHCPTVTACANLGQVSYNMSLSSPTMNNESVGPEVKKAPSVDSGR